jgi:hypothetical protein
MKLFANSIGWEFTLKGMPSFTDYVIGVDTKLDHVISERHGTFHVDICDLTGKKRPKQQG